MRQAINKEVSEDPRCLGQGQRKELGLRYKSLNPREGFDMERGPPRQAAMFGATFCACPEGDSPSAKRQYDAVVTGCIPVLVSNEAIYAYSSENGGDLDPSDFSVRISEESVVTPAPGVGGMIAQLERVGPEEASRRAGAGSPMGQRGNWLMW